MEKIFSMTGFGKGEAVGEHYTVIVEIKSVNNRFKDYRMRLPSLLSDQELNLRQSLDHEIRRGSLDISVAYKKNDQASKFTDIDSKKIEDFLSLVKGCADKVGAQLVVQATEFMKTDFYKDNDEDKRAELLSLLEEASHQGISSLKISREQEAIKLMENIKKHKNDFKDYFKKIILLKNDYKEHIEKKLHKKFSEKQQSLDLDDSRFYQEVIYYLEKLDVDEEINRIEAHLSKFDSIFVDGGEVGRKLDFLLQELNRETNTIGSKSGHEKISENIVEMKVQLEKIREQALNLE